MESVTVEEHGAGAEAHKVLRVGDVTLTAFVGAGDEEPRVGGTDLAAWIEFGRARDFRKLVKRHEVAGNVRPTWRATVARQAVGFGDRGREYTFEEPYLTEPDALFIITQSETPKAIAITKKIIDVFMAVRRGTLSSVSVVAISGIVERAIAAVVAPLRDELRALAVAHAARPDAGTISRAQADKLRAEFCEIAGLASGAQRRSRLWMRARSKADNAARRTVKLPIGRAWDSLPAGLYADALARAKELRADAQRLADERRQPELFPKKGGA